MVSSEVQNAISDWSEWAYEQDTPRYDIALFKVWIQFEKFVSDLFVSYSIGNASETGYLPERVINFNSEEQFNAFMKEGNAKFIRYYDKMGSLSGYIFDTNPFEIILADSKYTSVINEVKALRNYIAHESEEARRKVINICFNGNERKFIEPNDYLKKKEKETKTKYFDYYLDSIQEMVAILISAPPEESGVAT